MSSEQVYGACGETPIRTSADSSTRARFSPNWRSASAGSVAKTSR